MTWRMLVVRVLREALPATAGAAAIALSEAGVLPPAVAQAAQGLVAALFGL